MRREVRSSHVHVHGPVHVHVTCYMYLHTLQVTSDVFSELNIDLQLVAGNLYVRIGPVNVANHLQMLF